MAKKKKATAAMQRYAPRVQMYAAKAAPLVRRVGGATAKAAFSERHTLIALASAAALGYADKENMLDRMTLIEGVDPKTQLALGLWLAGKFTKNSTIQHVATGVGSVALYDFIKSR